MFRKTSILLILLIFTTMLVGAQETPPNDAPLFTIPNSEPDIKRGPFGEWDGKYTDPGAVVYHDGLFHMFRNGFEGWPASVQIGYLTSEDGLTWTEVTEEPVLTSKEVALTTVAALASSALVEEDGTWVLYFYTWDTYRWQTGEGVIGRATASDPLGPWTVDAEAVLTPGSAGEWDSVQVAAPTVVRTEDGYRMFYTGYDENYTQNVGIAESADGITWTKYNDPATTEAPFAESDPVLMASETWEGGSVHQARAAQMEDGTWMMIYRTPGNGSSTMSFNLAFSEDGIVWTKYAGNPVMSPGEFGPTTRAFWYNAMVYREGHIYFYVEVMPRAEETNIYSTIYEGPLPPK